MTGPAPARQAFHGFGEEALIFYEGLEADNSRTYWSTHQERYEQAVRDPMLALLDGLEPEFGPGRMFRPHRDLRFSADKSPYKTHAGAIVGSGGGVGGLYVQVSAEGLMVAGGYYQMSGPQLARYRTAVQADRSGAAVEAVIARAVKGGASIAAAQRLQRAPRGIDPDHPRIDLLRLKGLALSREFGAPQWLGTRRCKAEVATAWRAFGPLMEWLTEHVGADDPTGP